MKSNQKGFTLTDLLVSLGLVSVVLAATVKSLSLQTRVQVRDEIGAMADQNLRLAMDSVVDVMRAAGDSVPRENLAAWFPWVPGFVANPTLRSGSDPEITVARCTPLPVASLQVTGAEGSYHLVLESAVGGKNVDQLVNTDARRVVVLDDTIPAVVKVVSGTQIDIDTDPVASGLQGLPRPLVVGAPVCRVEVITFRIVETIDGRSLLVADPNDGSTAKSIAEGITDMQIDEVEAGRRYRVRLTAAGDHEDPLTGEPIVRRLRSLVYLRNADTEGG